LSFNIFTDLAISLSLLSTGGLTFPVRCKPLNVRLQNLVAKKLEPLLYCMIQMCFDIWNWLGSQVWRTDRENGL